MDKRFSWIFLLVSGAFFVFIVGLTGYRIENARRVNAAMARERLPEIASMIRSLRDSSGSYDSPVFKKDLRGVFEAESRLLLLCIHSPESGIVYLVTRNRGFLKVPAAITSDWRGTPTYSVSRGYEIMQSAPLSDGEQELTLDAMFVVLGREDLYPVVRDDLFLFLAFLLVCGVVILITTSIQQDSMARPWPGSAAPTTPGPAQAVASASWAEPAASERSHTGGPASGAPHSEGRAPEGERALTSPRSGLVWSEYLEPRLRAELERAASSDLELSLARLRIDEPFADAKLPLVYTEIARMLLQAFPQHDLIFETGNDSCTLVLPEMDVDSALKRLDGFRSKVAGTPVEGRTRTVSIGVSSRGGRLLDERTLREEADVAVAKASREGGNQVIGFRADAARVRDKLQS
jgi:GGDEF domain-containing protein